MADRVKPVGEVLPPHRSGILSSNLSLHQRFHSYHNYRPRIPRVPCLCGPSHRRLLFDELGANFSCAFVDLATDLKKKLDRAAYCLHGSKFPVFFSNQWDLLRLFDELGANFSCRCFRGLYRRVHKWLLERSTLRH